MGLLTVKTKLSQIRYVSTLGRGNVKKSTQVKMSNLVAENSSTFNSSLLLWWQI